MQMGFIAQKIFRKLIFDLKSILMRNIVQLAIIVLMIFILQKQRKSLLCLQ